MSPLREVAANGQDNFWQRHSRCGSFIGGPKRAAGFVHKSCFGVQKHAACCA